MIVYWPRTSVTKGNIYRHSYLSTLWATMEINCKSLKIVEKLETPSLEESFFFSKQLIGQFAAIWHSTVRNDFSDW